MSKKTIELSKKFDAPAAVVFQAIKEGQLLKSTGVKPDSFKHDFRVGGDFSLQWSCVEGSACTGRYLEIVPNEQVRFTWTSTGCEGATKDETIVNVTLKDQGKKCEMTLVHEGLVAGISADDHLKGWTKSLDEFLAEIHRLASIS
jgi:uncharacterized protein YndB with AHSA1/START domain